MRKLFMTAALVLALTAPAAAALSLKIRVAQAEVTVLASAPVPDEMAPVLHNGSLMIMTRSSNGHVEIRYEQPRAGMPVTKGALVFTGQYDGKRNTYTGVAYMFKRGCEPAPYPVDGAMTGPGVILSGSPPIRDRHSCAILGEVPFSRFAAESNKNMRLVFEFEPEGD